MTMKPDPGIQAYNQRQCPGYPSPLHQPRAAVSCKASGAAALQLTAPEAAAAGPPRPKAQPFECPQQYRKLMTG